MMNAPRRVTLCWATVLILLISAATAPAQKPYRLPDLGDNFKNRIIWGSQAESPDGFTLAFGGQDQQSDHGIGHTRIKVKGGNWQVAHGEFIENHPVPQDDYERLREIRESALAVLARLRTVNLSGPSDDTRKQILTSAANELTNCRVTYATAHDTYLPWIERSLRGAIWRRARPFTRGFFEVAFTISSELQRGETSPDQLRKLEMAIVNLQKAIDVLTPEPPPRALSPIVYEPKSGLFFIFGGDHFDYLMNDVWAFDPKEKRWSVLLQDKAPRPRANHALKATGDGEIVMTGGYTYSSNTDYSGGQYVDLDDGEWVYDVEKNTWTGEGEMVDSMSRTYRTGPFHPEYFYDPKPDRESHEELLAELPANQWVKLDPPKLPRLNRDWGTAVLDPDRDLILRYSGGHSAHGGTDVLHYHIATNRWELCFPVEFPLGQLYANTRYPNGFNFNGRPWITGHTYQNYGYDRNLRKMLFSGRPEYTYIYDIDRGDWDGRIRKPQSMIYNSCFYTLTHCSTPHGLVCWTKAEDSLRYFSAEDMEWHGLAIESGHLPGAVVDNSTLVHDSKRKRLLFFVKPYGKDHKYDGQIYAYGLHTGQVTNLSPRGMDAADAIPYLCQIRYDETNDLLLVGGTLPPGEDGLRRTPAYDPERNQWISLKITGDDPSGERGRNVSLGMMYEPKRKLFLAVDTNSQVYALRLHVETADVQPLK